MGVMVVLELLLEQVRRVVGEVLRDVGLTSAAWQRMWWLSADGPSTGAELAEQTCRRRQEVQTILERMRAAGLVERLPHPVTGKTAAWALTEEGRRRLEWSARRLRVHDELLECEFRTQLPEVMTVLARIRTVLRTQELSSDGKLIERRLRAMDKLVPPKRWTAAEWDL